MQLRCGKEGSKTKPFLFLADEIAKLELLGPSEHTTTGTDNNNSNSYETPSLQPNNNPRVYHTGTDNN